MKRQKVQNSITQVGQLPATRVRDRAKYRCPDDLEHLIDLVNSVPPNRWLMPFNFIKQQAEDAEDIEMFTSLISANLRGVPQEYLDKFPTGFHLEKAYNTFRNLRDAIRKLARLASEQSADTRRHLVTFEVSLWTDMSDLKISAIGIEWFQPLFALTPEQIKRVRICEVCDNVFWAKQHNSRACSSRCSNVHAQRELRKRQKDYEAARKKKRARAKRVAKTAR